MTSSGEILLSSHEMAEFVSTGFVRFDAVVPTDVNEAAVEAFGAGLAPVPAGQSLAATYPSGGVVRRIVELPRIQGAISSLVGPAPIVDHHYLHIRYAEEKSVQRLHSDGMLDLRRTGFDVQLMYYPTAVPPEMGATLVVPGSHFRTVNELDIARYQNLRGQVLMDCPAGTVVFAHHGLWHCGTPNSTATVRYMLQLRLNPTTAQCRTWDVGDLDDPAIDAVLARKFAWFEYADARFELVHRIRAWRALTGQPDYDIDMLMTRLASVGEADRRSPGPR